MLWPVLVYPWDKRLCDTMRHHSGGVFGPGLMRADGVYWANPDSGRPHPGLSLHPYWWQWGADSWPPPKRRQ